MPLVVVVKIVCPNVSTGPRERTATCVFVVVHYLNFFVRDDRSYMCDAVFDLRTSTNTLASPGERMEDDSNIYGYDPSLPGAISTAAVFCILTLLHAYQALRSRCWHFVWFVLGGCFEAAGYIIRILSIEQDPDYDVTIFATSLALILVAPALFAASIYMSLGRTVRIIQAEEKSLIRVTWMTKIFVAGDVLAFAIQGVGAIILVRQTKGSFSQGSTIIIVGLLVQIIFFDFFLLQSWIIHWRIARHPTDRSRNPAVPWSKHLRSLYMACIVIMARCAYRLVEYVQGKRGNGYLMNHEWCMYVFDALPMVLVMLWVFIRHPSELMAMSKARGGIAMQYLKGRPVGPINDHWRVPPCPAMTSTAVYGLQPPATMAARRY